MDNKTAWLILYSGILAFQFHPRNKTVEMFENLDKEINTCAEIADMAMTEYTKRFGGEKWPG